MERYKEREKNLPQPGDRVMFTDESEIKRTGIVIAYREERTGTAKVEIVSGGMIHFCTPWSLIRLPGSEKYQERALAYSASKEKSPITKNLQKLDKDSWLRTGERLGRGEEYSRLKTLKTG